MIKDSGARKEFGTGAVRDITEDKGRCDLMPIRVVADITKLPLLYHIDDFIKSDFKKTSFLQNAIEDFCENEIYHNKITMMLEVSKHFEEGAKKYGENNWKKGIPVNSYIDSAIRHYLKYRRGDEDENHERAFIWNLMCCIWTVQNATNIKLTDEKNRNTLQANNNPEKRCAWSCDNILIEDEE